MEPLSQILFNFKNWSFLKDTGISTEFCDCVVFQVKAKDISAATYYSSVIIPL